MTWAEFIEAELLKQYRRGHQIPMVQLRAFIDHLRTEMQVSYPLAHARPFASGRTLLFDAQGVAGLDADFALVVHGG